MNIEQLEIQEMENVTGGSGWDCGGAALGAIGLVAGVVLTPATGGLSAWAVAGALAGGFGTGISLDGCFSY